LVPDQDGLTADVVNLPAVRGIGDHPKLVILDYGRGPKLLGQAVDKGLELCRRHS
jgi:hypothetical protein